MTTRRVGARPRSRMARRPGVPLRRRIGARLPSMVRFLAATAGVAAGAALVALAGGPWLTVERLSWEGDHLTPTDALERALEDERGRAILAVDTAAVEERLEALPSVATAEVRASLTGAVTATIFEREPAFVWDTTRARFIGADDGTLYAVLAGDEALPDGLAARPTVTDERREGWLLTVGDVIPGALLRTAHALSDLDPAALGSKAAIASVRLNDEYGFVLATAEPGWEIAFGLSGLDPRQTAAAAEARLEQQVTAVRTLFAGEEESGVGWVDVRNPGKVYFRAKG